MHTASPLLFHIFVRVFHSSNLPVASRQKRFLVVTELPRLCHVTEQLIGVASGVPGWGNQNTKLKVQSLCIDQTAPRGHIPQIQCASWCVSTLRIDTQNRVGMRILVTPYPANRLHPQRLSSYSTYPVVTPVNCMDKRRRAVLVQHVDVHHWAECLEDSIVLTCLRFGE